MQSIRGIRDDENFFAKICAANLDVYACSYRVKYLRNSKEHVYPATHPSVEAPPRTPRYLLSAPLLRPAYDDTPLRNLRAVN
jgi:hypothetical protein